VVSGQSSGDAFLARVLSRDLRHATAINPFLFQKSCEGRQDILDRRRETERETERDRERERERDRERQRERIAIAIAMPILYRL
jgi:hypothetical protein